MTIIRSVLQSLREHPWSLLLVQLPAASINPIQDLGETWLEAHPILGVILCLPYLFLTSFVSSGGTLQVVRDGSSGKKALTTAFARWRLLLPAGVIAGSLILLGLVAVVIPGIYFASIYLFLPYLIMEEADQPLTVYMYRSKQLAKTQFKTTILVVVSVLFIMTWSFLFGDWFATLIAGNTMGAFGQKCIQILTHLVLAIFVGTVVDVWISHYFLRLRGKAQQ